MFHPPNSKYSEKILKDPPKCTHVIFDMDGVITASEPIYEKMINEILDRYGYKLNPIINSKRKGLTGIDVSKLIVDEYDLPISSAEFRIDLLTLYPIYLPQVELIPGAAQLINHLYVNNIPMGLATGSTKLSYELKTKNYKCLFKRFHHVVLAGSDPEVKKGKPEPDVFKTCAARFAVPKPMHNHILVIEDAYNGVLAATKAGMYTLAIPDEDAPFEIFDLASAVVSRFDYLDLTKFGLPPIDPETTSIAPDIIKLEMEKKKRDSVFAI